MTKTSRTAVSIAMSTSTRSQFRGLDFAVSAGQASKFT